MALTQWGLYIRYNQGAFTAALFLTCILKFFQDFRTSKPSVVNAFQYVYRAPTNMFGVSDATKIEINSELWMVNGELFLAIGDCTMTMTTPFSIIYANTPWQVLYSPPRICQRGLAGSRLAPVQRTYNERVRTYIITFLPPGMFL